MLPDHVAVNVFTSLRLVLVPTVDDRVAIGTALAARECSRARRATVYCAGGEVRGGTSRFRPAGAACEHPPLQSDACVTSFSKSVSAGADQTALTEALERAARESQP